MELQSIDLQPYVPTFVVALAVALGLAVVLINLLWIVGRLIPVPGKRLWRVVRMLFMFTLQVLILVGAVLLILRFIGVDVAWLALIFIGMFGIGSLLSRWNSDRQPQPGTSDLPAQPSVQAVATAEGVMPVVAAPLPDAPAAPALATAEGVMPAAAAPALATAEGVMSVAAAPLLVAPAAPAADTVVRAEPIPSDSQEPAPSSGDTSPPEPVSVTELGAGSPAMLATTPESDAAPDNTPLETGGQEVVLANVLPNSDDHLEAPVQRPWQNHEPVPLTRRFALGRSTIRAMRTNK